MIGGEGDDSLLGDSDLFPQKFDWTITDAISGNTFERTFNFSLGSVVGTASGNDLIYSGGGNDFVAAGRGDDGCRGSS